MSASDIQTYRGCPLRYKFARVLRIPAPQTVQQRFGIVVHQVLERYHSGSDQTLEAMLELLEQVWRRSALGETESDLRLHGEGPRRPLPLPRPPVGGVGGPGLVRALVLVPASAPTTCAGAWTASTASPTAPSTATS